MSPKPFSELINHTKVANRASAEQAATEVEASVANPSRWRARDPKPGKRLENRIRPLADDRSSSVAIAGSSREKSRLECLEGAISGTLHALREEFHRTASVSTRQEVLDLAAALFFVHVTSIDDQGTGIGQHLRAKNQTAVSALNGFMVNAFSRYLPVRNGERKSGRRP